METLGSISAEGADQPHILAIFKQGSKWYIALDGGEDYVAVEAAAVELGEESYLTAGANGTGKTISGTITVSTDEDYPVKSYVISVSQAAKVAGVKYYVKVTAAPGDWSGKYLIVYEEGGLALDGSLSKIDAVNDYKEVSVEAGQIISDATTDAIAFTVAPSFESQIRR